MDKIVVITGGTSGIGLELKKLYESNGDTVLTASIDNIDDEKHFVCDVTNEIKVKQVIFGIGQKYGKIDVLINCAGIGMSGITEIVPTEQIQKLVEVNYYGTLYTIRTAIQFMQPGSKIVNIASAMALFPVPFRSIYGSIKSAVLTLSYSLRMELKHLGIDVVAICPGDIKTNFTKNRIKEFETNERYGDRLETATVKSDSREEKRIPADKCALQIFKKISKEKCKPMYIIGGKYKFLYFLTKITPKSWLLNITGKLYGGVETKPEEKPKKTKVEESPTVTVEQTPATPVEEDIEKAAEEETVEENPFANTPKMETKEESTEEAKETETEPTEEEKQEQEEKEEISEENKTKEPSEENKKADFASMLQKIQNKNNEEISNDK